MTISGFVRRVASYVERHGLLHTVRRAWEKACDRVFLRYERLWRASKADAAALADMRAHPISGVGRFSVVIPVYNTAPELLQALADALLGQAYPDWEACLYNGMSTRQETIDMLDRIAAGDARFRVVHGTANDGISGNSNHALAMATGEWVALCDHDDLLEPDALYRMAEAIRDQQPDMLYSDEDFINASGSIHTSPHFKPDFCPDTLRSGNYICHLMVLRRELLNKIGGFRPETDGSQDHDVALRASEHTSRIVHVPHVLYHWRQMGTSMSHQQLQRCLDAGALAVEQHIARIGYPGKVTHQHAQLRIAYDVDRSASIRVILLSDGDAQKEQRAREAVERTNRRAVVDVRRIGSSPWQAINDAAAAASEDFLVLLDSSVDMQDDHWLDELQMYAQRDDVAAATALLVNRRGRVVHAGYAVGMAGGVQCRGLNLVARSGGWHGILNTTHNVSAVAHGCLMIRRDHFVPFDCGYREGFAAADWSLQLGKNGLRHVVVPFAKGTCRDGNFISKYLLAGKYRHPEDMEKFSRKWKNVNDSCYSIRFNRQRANYTAHP